MKLIFPNKFLPAIIWFFIVLVLLCLPGNDLPETSNWFHQYNMDKLVHAFLFGVLCFLCMYPFKTMEIKKPEKIYFFIRIAIAISIWGLTTEFIQKFYIPFRSFDLLDWAADSVGAAISFGWGKKYC